jgi:hypothetical protein
VVDGHVDAVAVDAGQVKPQLDLAVAADDVHPHARVPAISGPEYPVELSERVKRCKQHVPLTLLAFPGPQTQGYSLMQKRKPIS